MRAPPKMRRPLPGEELSVALEMFSKDLEAAMTWISEAVERVGRAGQRWDAEENRWVGRDS